MFKLFSKPTVDSVKPKHRQKALLTLAGSSPALINVALNDTDYDTRLQAIEKLTDIETLKVIYHESSSTSPALQKLCLEKLEALLPDAKSFSQIADLKLANRQIEKLATESPSSAIRLLAIQQLQSPDILKDKAVNDASSAVRQAALAKIDDISIFEKIITIYKGKDKTLVKLAESKRNEALLAQQKQDQLADTLADMAKLADGDTKNISTFVKLESSWNELSSNATPEQHQQWLNAHSSAQQVFKTESDKRAIRQGIFAKATELNNELVELPYLSGKEGDQLLEKIVGFQTEWQQIGSGEDPESLKIERECNQVFKSLQQNYQRLNRNFKHSQKQRKIIEKVDHASQQSGMVQEQDIEQFKKLWSTSSKVDTPALQQQLDSFFNQKINKLTARVEAGQQARSQEQNNLDSLIEKLDQAIEKDSLQDAVNARNKLQDLLKASIGLKPDEITKAKQKLQYHQPDIKKLQDWARWGGEQAREHIIADLRAAVADDASPKAIVDMLKSARQQWRNLDKQSGYASRALRNEFEEICKQVHEPVKEHYQEVAQDQEQAITAREQICEALEKLESDTDWSRFSDWKSLSKTVQSHQNSWQKCGGVAREQWKAVNDRYFEAKQKLNQRIKPQLERELARRQRLIDQAIKLSEMEDSQQATEQVKQLRSQWAPVMTTHRRKENEMWEAFNKACDAVFDKQRANYAEQNAENNALLDSRRALLKELQTLSKEMTTAHWQQQLSARRDIEALQQTWVHQQEASGIAAEKIQKQWDSTLNQTSKIMTEAEQEKQLVMIKGLLQTAATLATLETEKLNDSSTTQSQAAYDHLKALYPDAAHKLADRAELKAVDESQHTALEERCLAEEIIAQVASPEQYQQQRRELQIALLAEQMTQVHSNDQKLEQLEARLHEWIAIPAPNAAALYQRYEKALQAQLDDLAPKGRTLSPPQIETEQVDNTETAESSETKSESEAEVTVDDIQEPQQKQDSEQPNA